MDRLELRSMSLSRFFKMIGMLWKRCFGQEKKCWRRTYKVRCVASQLTLSNVEVDSEETFRLRKNEAIVFVQGL